MKTNWPIKKLEEVAGIIVGKTPGTIDYLNFGEYKVLKYRDITKNGVDWDKYDKGFVKQNSLKGLKEVQLGDLLITSAGHSSEKIGEEAVVIEKLPSQFKKVFFASELICYRAIPKIILPEWLLLYILSEFGQSQLKKIIGDSVHLTKEKSQEIEIPVPAIEEQKRIVKKLEKILAKIEEFCILRQESIEEAIKLKRSTISNILNKKWSAKTLKDLSDNLDSKRKPVTKSSREKGEYPYYGASGIVDYVKDYIFDDDLLLVSEDGANLLARTYPIAFSISGRNWVNNHAHVLKFENKSTQKFIEYYLNSADISSYVSGTAQPKLNQENLNKIQIPIPDLTAQEKIVAYLDGLSEKVQTLQKLQQEQLQDLEALRQAVLHQAFEGKLRQIKSTSEVD